MTPPEIVYHYTSAKGLLGILSTRTIWATDVEFLNDAEELTYARKDVVAELYRRADEIFPIEQLDPPDTAEWSQATILRSAANTLAQPTETAYHVYVTCFCEDQNLLSQWRAYGTDGGYAIGFRTSALVEILGLPDASTKETMHLHLEQVAYGLEHAWPRLDAVLDRVAPSPTGHPTERGYKRAMTIVLPVVASIKHPDFSEEHEWRLVTTETGVRDQVHFRAEQTRVVPYLKFVLPRGAIANVVVGPGQHSDVRMNGIWQLLARQDMRDVKIIGSTTPLRR